MFKDVKTDFKFPAAEEEVIAFWKANGIFKKSVDKKGSKGVFLFYEGPPTANGTPHAGHVLTRVIKDLFPRYKTMNGFTVRRKAGWDTHGLPVEIEVEKQLGINGKDEIEKYGIQPFVEKCRQSVFTYLADWNRITERIGFWIDLDDPYVTFHTSYVESVWWALHTIWQKGLLYKGFKIIPYCPRCGTALSSHEVGQGYKTVKDPSIFVKFKVKGADNRYFLAWTTTPWTLISNAALAVGPEFDYVTVEFEGTELILARELLGKVFGEKKEYTVKAECKGRDLVGMDYEPLYNFEPPAKRAHFVIGAGFVSLADGTGIVHSAPAFGEDDYQSGLANDLPVIQLVDTRGRFKECVTPWKGVFVKDADAQIIKELKSRGLLFHQALYEHEYPFCWRCESPLLYYARSSWFIRTTAVKEKLLANNDTVGWFPDNIRSGRFGDFLRNNIDWALSRERYWGTPLPVWECAACGAQECVPSVAELRKRNPAVPADLDPHRPWIDAVTIPCPKCGAEMRRVKEVIDCWFDSGAMPFAQWGYPHKGRAVFDESFPCDFISEAIDQTRGWFYSLLAIGTLLFDKAPYKNCLVLGHVCDKNGKKMSKRLGNYTDPWDVMNKQGADAMRWYFYSSNHPWVNVRFFDDAVTESQKEFLMTLKNVYAFFTIYANIDGFDPAAGGGRYGAGYAGHPDWVPVEKRALLDRWFMAVLNDAVATVRDRLEHYDIYNACEKLAACVDGLSNWFVRRSRDRFWKAGKDKDKMAAYWTLYESLETLGRTLAPFVPFFTEEMYQNLVRVPFPGAPESVHLCDYPVADEKLIDRRLIDEMAVVREIVATGRSVRSTVRIKTRQPLVDATVVLVDAALKARAAAYAAVIGEELNVKHVVFSDRADDFVTYDIKPNFKLLGPRLGPKVKLLGTALAGMSGEAKRALINGGTLAVDGESLTFTREEFDVRIASKPGYAAGEGRGMVVVLNTAITPELEAEGLAREIVNRIQGLRKEARLDYQARIRTTLTGDAAVQAVIDSHGVFIKGETLTTELVWAESVPGGTAFEVDDLKLTIAITPV